MNNALQFIYSNIFVACFGLCGGIITVIFNSNVWLFRIGVAIFFSGIFVAAAMAGISISLLLDKYPIGKLP